MHTPISLYRVFSLLTPHPTRLSVPKMSTTPTSSCCQSSLPSLKSAHQTLPPNMRSSIISKPQAHQSPLVLDVSHPTASKLPRGNSSTSSNSASYAPPPAPGRNPSTWCPRGLLVTGIPVVTIYHSQPLHCSRPLPHTRFFFLPAGCHCLLKTGSSPSIPQDPSGPVRCYPDRSYHSIFGLRNAAQTFQRFLDQVLRGIPSAYAYIDDVLIASRTPEQHLTDIRTIFGRLSSRDHHQPEQVCFRCFRARLPGTPH